MRGTIKSHPKSVSSGKIRCLNRTAMVTTRAKDRYDTPPAEEETYDLGILEKSFDKWQRSRPLQIVYKQILRELLSFKQTGPILEIGSGCGFSRAVDSSIATSDIAPTRFCSRGVSAYQIPTNDPMWANILAFDVLHHLRSPMLFFSSAANALAKGGRILLCEPAGTLFGRAFYKAFHEEPCRPNKIRAPYEFEIEQQDTSLFANMGMAWALFERDTEQVATYLDSLGLSIRSVIYRDFLAYPATGGLSKPSLLPTSFFGPILAMEKRIPQCIMKRIALRMLIVIEKS